MVCPWPRARSVSFPRRAIRPRDQPNACDGDRGLGFRASRQARNDGMLANIQHKSSNPAADGETDCRAGVARNLDTQADATNVLLRRPTAGARPGPSIAIAAASGRNGGREAVVSHQGCDIVPGCATNGCTDTALADAAQSRTLITEGARRCEEASSIHHRNVCLHRETSG